MPKRLDRRQVSLLIHAVAVACCVCLYLVVERPAIVLQAGGLIILTTYLWLTLREGTDAPLGLSPATVFFAWFSIGYGLASFWAGKRLGEGELIPFSVVFLDPRTLGPGFLICIVGALALHAGLNLSRPPKDAAVQPTPPPLAARTGTVLLAIWVLALFVRVFLEESKWLGGLSGIIQWGGLSSLSLYALTEGPKKKHSKVFWPILLTGCALEMLLSLSGGSKAYLMFSFLPLIWLATSDRRFRLWMIPLSLVFGLVYFQLVWPVITQARVTPQKEGEGNAALILRVFLSEARDEPDLGRGREEFLSRQFEAAPTAFIYGEAERYGFQHGSTLSYLGFGLIPRVLWPDKPTINRGRWFDTYIAHNSSEGDPGNCLGQSSAGELYWNFGWPGVVGGMLVLGLLVGWLWRMATPTPLGDPIRMLLYTQVSVLMISFADAGVALLGLVQRILVFGILFWIIARWRGRSKVASPRRRSSRSSFLGLETVGPDPSGSVTPSPTSTN